MIKSGPGQGFRCSSAWQPFPEGTQRGHFSETVHACVGKVQQCRDLPNVNCYIVSLISPSTTQTHTAPAPVYNTRCQARPDRGTCLPSPFFGPPPLPRDAPAATGRPRPSASRSACVGGAEPDGEVPLRRGGAAGRHGAQPLRLRGAGNGVGCWLVRLGVPFLGVRQ